MNKLLVIEQRKTWKTSFPPESVIVLLFCHNQNMFQLYDTLEGSILSKREDKNLH